HRQGGPGGQFRHPRADHVHAQHRPPRPVGHHLHVALGSPQGEGPAGGGQGEPEGGDVGAGGGGLLPGGAHGGDLGIGENDGGNGGRIEGGRSPGGGRRRHLGLGGRLVS